MADQQPPAAPGSRSRTRLALQVVGSLVLVAAIFYYLFQGIDLAQVWADIRAMTWLEDLTLLAAAVWNMATYSLVWMTVAPGLGFWRATMMSQSTAAVSSTVPWAGPVIGTGMTYSMFGQWGYSGAHTTTAVLVSGVWNSFAKLGLPVLALALLALQGGASGGRVIAGLVGIAGLVAAIVVFALILRSEELAHRFGRWANMVPGWWVTWTTSSGCQPGPSSTAPAVSTAYRLPRNSSARSTRQRARDLARSQTVTAYSLPSCNRCTWRSSMLGVADCWSAARLAAHASLLASVTRTRRVPWPACQRPRPDLKARVLHMLSGRSRRRRALRACAHGAAGGRGATLRLLATDRAGAGGTPQLTEQDRDGEDDGNSGRQQFTKHPAVTTGTRQPRCDRPRRRHTLHPVTVAADPNAS
jgi:hypothetical protein